MLNPSFLNEHENFFYLTETYEPRGGMLRFDPILLLKVAIYVQVLWSTYSDEIDIPSLSPYEGWSNFEDKIIQ